MSSGSLSSLIPNGSSDYDTDRHSVFSLNSDATEATTVNDNNDGADRVKVAVRVRPFTKEEKARNVKCIISMQDNSTDVLDPTFYSGEITHDIDKDHYTRRFNFDHSFWSHIPTDPSAATQAIVFNALGSYLLDNALRGYNCSLFAYGQTGSGKTHTMIGEEGGSLQGKESGSGGLDMSEIGVVPRLCKELFERVKAASVPPPPPPVDPDGNPHPQPVARDGRLVRAGVVVQFYEIYNESVRDLFAPTTNTKHTLRVREDPKTGVFVEKLTSHPVKNYQMVMSLLEKGSNARTTASTNMNATSSRSHAVFCLMLRAEIEEPSTPGVINERISKISLVDLAGSERANATGVTGDRLREAANINKSLSTLGDVIKALTKKSSAKNSNFIPYRNSALTWLLKDSLGGNSKTVMLAAISPSEHHYNETMSTLRYVERAKQIVNNAVVNDGETNPVVLLLRQEINRLRDDLGKQDVRFREQEMIWERKVETQTNKFEAKERRFEEIITRCITEKETQVGQLMREKEKQQEALEEASGANAILLEQIDEVSTNMGNVEEEKKKCEGEISALLQKLNLVGADKENQSAKLQKDIQKEQREKYELKLTLESLKVEFNGEKEKIRAIVAERDKSIQALHIDCQSAKDEIRKLEETKSREVMELNELVRCKEGTLANIVEAKAKVAQEFEQFKIDAIDAERKLQKEGDIAFQDLQIVKKQAEIDMKAAASKWLEEKVAFNKRIEDIKLDNEGQLEKSALEVQRLNDITEELRRQIEEREKASKRELETALMEANENMRKMDEGHQTKLADLKLQMEEVRQAEIASLVQANKQASQEIKEECAIELANSKEALLKEQNEALSVLREEHTAVLQKAHDDHSAEHASTVDQHAKATDELMQQKDSELAALREEHAALLQKAHDDHSAEHASTVDQHAKATDELMQQKDSELAALREEHAALLQQTKDDHSAEHASTLDQVRSTLLKEKEDELAAVKASLVASHDEAVANLQADLTKMKDSELAALREEHAAVLQKAHEDHSAEHASTVDQHAKATDELMQQKDSELAALREEHAALLQQTKDDHSAEHASTLDQVRSTLLKEKEDELAAVKASLVASHDEAVANLQADLTKMKDSELAALREEHAALLKQKHDEQQSAHATEIEKIRGEHDSLIQSVKSDVSQTMEQHAQLIKDIKADHDGEINKAKSEHQTLYDQALAAQKQTTAEHESKLHEVNESHASAIAELNRKLETLTEDLINEKKNSATLETEKANEINTVDMLLVEKNELNKSLEQAVRALQTQVDNEQEKIQEKKMENESLQQSLKLFEEEMATAQMELGQLKESRDDIQLQLEASQSSLFDEIAKNESHEVNIKELKEEAAKQERHIELLEQEASSHSDAIKQVESQLERAATDKANINRKYLEGVEKVDKMKSETTIMSDELKGSKTELKEYKKNFDTMEKDFIQAKLETAETKTAFDQLKLKNKILEQDYVNVKLKLAEACANLDDCRAIVANFAKPRKAKK